MNSSSTLAAPSRPRNDRLGGRLLIPCPIVAYTAYCCLECLLPIAYYCLLPILTAAYCLYIAYFLLPTACLLPTAYCLLPTAYCLLPTAYCLLPTAYCLLPTAYCLLPTAYSYYRYSTAYYCLYCLLPIYTSFRPLDLYCLQYCLLLPIHYEYCLLPTAYSTVLYCLQPKSTVEYCTTAQVLYSTTIAWNGAPEGFDISREDRRGTYEIITETYDNLI